MIPRAGERSKSKWSSRRRDSNRRLQLARELVQPRAARNHFSRRSTTPHRSRRRILPRLAAADANRAEAAPSAILFLIRLAPVRGKPLDSRRNSWRLRSTNPEGPSCRALNKSGERAGQQCTNQSKPGLLYCGKHEPRIPAKSTTPGLAERLGESALGKSDCYWHCGSRGEAGTFRLATRRYRETFYAALYRRRRSGMHRISRGTQQRPFCTELQ